MIGLILRDAGVIKQVIGFLDSPEVPQETVQSVRSGLLAVDTWASTDWWVIQCGWSSCCMLSEPCTVFTCVILTYLCLHLFQPGI